jgi:TP901 family phage tail tape measure protein
MAISADRMVKLIFEGDDRVSKTMASIESNLSNFSKGVESATQPLADIAEKALLAEAALAAMVVGGIVYATNEAGKFNDAFNEISTLIDASEKDIQGFKQEIIDYGREAKSSYEAINGAVYSAISAGVDYKSALESLNQAEKLSIAGKADLNSTTVLLAGTLNAYGEATTKAEKYSDIFFQTVKLGQTTIPELGSSLAQVTGIAAAGSVPIETLAAAIAAVTASGVPTSQTITSLKAAISNIIKPSAEAAKMAEALGIGFDATALKSKGFEGILREVWEATGGNVAQMAKLFGSTEALNAVLILAEDKTGKFKNALEVMANAAGSTEAAYQKMADNMSLVNQNLINNLTATVIQFGERFLDEYGGIAEGVSDIFKGISVGMDQGAFDPVFEFIEQAGRDLEKYLKDVARIMPEALDNVDFSGLLSSVRGLGGELRDLFDAFFGSIDLTTPEGLAKAIQKIVDSGESLTRVVSGILSGLEPFVAGLGKAVDATNDLDGSTKDIIGNVLGFATGLNKVVSALNVLGPAISVLAVTQIPGAIVQTGLLLTKMQGLSTLAAGAAAYGIGYFAGQLIDKYIPGVSQGTQAIFEMADKVLNFTGTQGKSNEMLKEADERLAAATIKFKEYQESVRASAKAASEFSLSDLKNELKEAGVLIEEVTEEKIFKIDTDLKDFFTDIDKVKLETLTWFNEAGEQKFLTVAVDLDDDEAKKKIDDITTEKTLDIKLQGEIEKELEHIKATAETVQTAIEWKAKLDIANVEAGVKKIEAAFNAANVIFESTGSLIDSLFTSLIGATSGPVAFMIKDQILEESRMREEAHEKSMEMMDLQIKMEEEKLSRMEKGQALYTIEAANLQPHLEAIWVEVIKAIQIRANEEGFEALVGL